MADEITGSATETAVDTAQPTEQATDTLATSQPAEGSEENKGAEKPAEGTEQPASREEKEASRLDTVIAARHKELASLQATIDKAKADLEAYNTQKAQFEELGKKGPEVDVLALGTFKGKLEDHPLLKGVETQLDDNNNLYVMQYGQPIPAAQWIMNREAILATQAMYHKGMVDPAQAETQAKQAAVEANRQAVYGAYAEQTEKSVKELFPHLADTPELLDYRISRVIQQVSAAMGDVPEGQYHTPEQFAEALKQTLDFELQLEGIAAKKQIEDNAKYAETYKVKPDGTAATPKPIDESKLTRAERLRLSDERTRLAMAMRQAT